MARRVIKSADGRYREIKLVTLNGVQIAQWKQWGVQWMMPIDAWNGYMDRAYRRKLKGLANSQAYPGNHWRRKD
jgi:hypothetical protein